MPSDVTPSTEPWTVAGCEYLATYLGHDHDLHRMQICRIEAEAVASLTTQLEQERAKVAALVSWADDLNKALGMTAWERLDVRLQANSALSDIIANSKIWLTCHDAREQAKGASAALSVERITTALGDHEMYDEDGNTYLDISGTTEEVAVALLAALTSTDKETQGV